MKHPYRPECPCPRCAKEAARRLTQRQKQDRTTAHVMIDWTASRNPRRRRIAAAYWDDFESGRPMDDGDR